jgi:hypothetical protein
MMDTELKRLKIPGLSIEAEQVMEPGGRIGHRRRTIYF